MRKQACEEDAGCGVEEYWVIFVRGLCSWGDLAAKHLQLPEKRLKRERRGTALLESAVIAVVAIVVLGLVGIQPRDNIASDFGLGLQCRPFPNACTTKDVVRVEDRGAVSRVERKLYGENMYTDQQPGTGHAVAVFRSHFLTL
jgi:hypothetical protein